MVNLHKYYYLIFAGSLIVYSWYLIIYILVFNSIITKKRYVAAILKGLRIIEVMSKPNDLKQK